MPHGKEWKMRHRMLVINLALAMLAVGCGQRRQVKVTYSSDPPGGTLYKLNGELWGPCPKVLWYDLDKEAIEERFLNVKGLIVRWPSGPEKRSGDLIRITVNGTDRRVTFSQPTITATTESGERAE